MGIVKKDFLSYNGNLTTLLVYVCVLAIEVLTYFLSNDFFRKKLQQNALSETHMYSKIKIAM